MIIRKLLKVGHLLGMCKGIESTERICQKSSAKREISKAVIAREVKKV